MVDLFIYILIAFRSDFCDKSTFYIFVHSAMVEKKFGDLVVQLKTRLLLDIYKVVVGGEIRYC